MKVKEKFERTRDVKNNIKSEKHNIREETNCGYHDRILSKSKEIQQNV